MLKGVLKQMPLWMGDWMSLPKGGRMFRPMDDWMPLRTPDWMSLPKDDSMFPPKDDWKFPRMAPRHQAGLLSRFRIRHWLCYLPRY